MSHRVTNSEQLALLVHRALPSPVFIALVVATCLWLWYAGALEAALTFLGSTAITAGVVSFIKLFTRTPRPTNALEDFKYSAFPSMHAALAGSTLVHACTVAKIFYANPFYFYLLALIVSCVVLWSRITIHAHTRTQTLIGFGIGLTVALAALVL